MLFHNYYFDHNEQSSFLQTFHSDSPTTILLVAYPTTHPVTPIHFSVITFLCTYPHLSIPTHTNPHPPRSILYNTIWYTCPYSPMHIHIHTIHLLANPTTSSHMHKLFRCHYMKHLPSQSTPSYTNPHPVTPIHTHLHPFKQI